MPFAGDKCAPWVNNQIFDVLNKRGFPVSRLRYERLFGRPVELLDMAFWGIARCFSTRSSLSSYWSRHWSVKVYYRKAAGEMRTGTLLEMLLSLKKHSPIIRL
jgi:hypothetical protein